MSVREQCSVAYQLLVWPVSSFGLVELLIEHWFVVSSSALKHRVGLNYYLWITTNNSTYYFLQHAAKKQDSQVHLLDAFQYIYFPLVSQIYSLLPSSYSTNRCLWLCLIMMLYTKWLMGYQDNVYTK